MTGWVMSEHGIPDSRLTVIERVDDYISPQGKHQTKWKCLCQCGKEVYVTRDQLSRKDGTKSCGCLHKEKASILNFKDLTGKVFGRLTVLERVNPPAHVKDTKSTYWKCQCECGNTTIVKRSSLIDKRTQSCGCIHDEKSAERLKKMFTKDYRKYDQNGNLIEKFCPTCNRWLPVSSFSSSTSVLDGYSWECKECYAYSVRNRYNAYKGAAKHRQLDFELSLNEFDKITSKACVYCGKYNGEYLGTPFSGIDRIDSSIGYKLDNCVSCCQICNKMKLNYSVGDWMEHMKLILNYYNKGQVI